METPPIINSMIPASRDERTLKAFERIGVFIGQKAQGTQLAYRSILTEYMDWLRSRGRHLLDASDTDGACYAKYLEAKPGQRPRVTLSTSTEIAPWGAIGFNRKRGIEISTAPNTLIKKLSMLRRIYRLLQVYRLTDNNPFESDKITPPRKGCPQKRPTKSVEDPQNVWKILEQLGKGSGEKGIRNMAIGVTLFACGLRRGEAADLRMCDYQRTPRGTPYVHLTHTKNGTSADVAVPEWAAAIIDEWVKIRVEQHNARQGDALFPSYTGKGASVLTERHITGAGIYALIREAAHAVGQEYITPHSARATAITQLLDQGVPHREVAIVSRHASVQMVELYDKRRLEIDEGPGRILDYRKTRKRG